MKLPGSGSLSFGIGDVFIVGRVCGFVRARSLFEDAGALFADGVSAFVEEEVVGVVHAVEAVYVFVGLSVAGDEGDGRVDRDARPGADDAPVGLDTVNPVFLSVDELGGGEGEAEGGQARLGFTQRAVVGYVGQGDGGLRARVEREEYGAAGLDILACLDRLPEYGAGGKGAYEARVGHFGSEAELPQLACGFGLAEATQVGHGDFLAVAGVAVEGEERAEYEAGGHDGHRQEVAPQDRAS